MGLVIRWMFLGLCAVVMSTVAHARVVGGSLVTAFHPISQHVVRLYIMDSQMKAYNCTGSLIASDIVLTSAHCLVGDILYIDVVFRDLVAGKTWRKTSTTYITHPEHDSKNKDHDIALVKLPTSHPSGFLPVKYMSRLSDLSDLDQGIHSTFHVAGYGVHDPTERSDNQLRAGRMKGEQVHLNILFLRPGAAGSSICHGDSGGPTYVQQKDGQVTLIGINTFSLRNKSGQIENDCTFGAGTTLIMPYVEWIEDSIAKL